MMRRALGRRAVLGVFGALAALPLAGCLVTGNPPLPRRRIRALAVPIPATPEPAAVARWRPRFAEALGAVYADLMSPGSAGAATLTVEIDTLAFTSTVGERDGVGGSITVSAGDGLPPLTRRITARGPEITLGLLEHGEDDRVAALADAFARAARRQFGD